MGKIFALYINELIKITRKISTIVMIIILVVGMLGVSVLFVIMDAMSENMNNFSEEFEKEMMNDDINRLKSQIDEIEKNGTIDKETKENELLNIRNELEMNEYAKNNKISITTGNYLSDALNKMFYYKLEKKQVEKIPDEKITTVDKQRLDRANKYISEFENVLKNKDYNKYLELSKEEIQSNKELSNDEKNIYLETVELKAKSKLGEIYKSNKNVDEQEIDVIMQSINEIEQDKFSLLNNLGQIGIEGRSKPLSLEDRENIENNIAINEYKVENNIIKKEFFNDALIGFGLFIVLILLIIIAGGNISSETSTGSIKSLVISPIKRWKIFTVKLMALVTITILCSIILYIVFLLINSLIFRFSDNYPYVYAVNGTVSTINFYLFAYLRLITDMIPLFIFVIFAFMLSTITRNTAVAVGISIGLYLVGNTVNQFISTSFTGEWLKFIPFNNLDFSLKVFPNYFDADMAQMMSNANTTLTFSIIYMLVLSICMFYIGLDSFNRRDIK